VVDHLPRAKWSIFLPVPELGGKRRATARWFLARRGYDAIHGGLIEEQVCSDLGPPGPLKPYAGFLERFIYLAHLTLPPSVLGSSSLPIATNVASLFASKTEAPSQRHASASL
jgi:hypothetical protein